MKTIARLLTVILFATPLAAFAQTQCPSSKGQPLTIQTVMIDFGRYVTPADDVTNAGLSPMNGSYTDTQIQDAVSNLGVAIACTDAVTTANGTNPLLLPSVTDLMSGDARTAYIADFLDLMLEFHDSLVAYQAGLTQLVQTPAASRNYVALGALKNAAAQAADHAHSKLAQESPKLISFTMTATDSIKNDMHNIGQLFRAIMSSSSDATQNSANATRAQQLDVLFTDCEGQVPDAIKAMPAAQQASAMADYNSILQSEATESAQLAAAFTSGDSATAQALITTMTQQKLDGHGKYNP